MKFALDRYKRATELLKRLNDASIDELGNEIERFCNLLGESIEKVNAIWLFEVQEDASVTCTHEWVSEPAFSRIKQFQWMDGARFPSFISILHEGRRVVINDADDYPDNATFERELGRRLSIKSIVFIPLFISKEPHAILGVASMRETKTWNEEDLVFIEMISGLINNALRRLKAERELLESRAFQDDVFVSIKDGISILDKDYTIVYVNQTMKDWYGDNLVGRKCYEAYHSRSSPCETCPTKMVLETLKYARELVPKRDSQGNVTGSLDLYSVPWFNRETGELLGVIEYVRDVTEREKALKALKDSERRFILAMETTGEGIWEINKEKEIRFATPRLLQMLGLKENGAWFMDRLVDIVFPEDRQVILKMNDFLGGKIQVDTLEIEFRATVASQETKWFLTRMRALERDLLGKPIHVFGTLIDVTRLRQAEEEVREYEKQSMRIIESIPIGIHMYKLLDDESLVFTGANPAADKILGIDHSTLKGKKILEAFPSAAGTVIPSKYAAIARAGGSWENEEIQYEDERIKGVFEVKAFQIARNEMVATFTDITERKRLEQMRRDFVEMTTHELKTPLSA